MRGNVSEKGGHSSRHDRSPVPLAGCPLFRSQNVEVVWQNLQEAMPICKAYIYPEVARGGCKKAWGQVSSWLTFQPQDNKICGAVEALLSLRSGDPSLPPGSVNCHCERSEAISTPGQWQRRIPGLLSRGPRDFTPRKDTLGPVTANAQNHFGNGPTCT